MMDSCISQGHFLEGKCENFRVWFALGWPNLFPPSITVTLSYVCRVFGHRLLGIIWHIISYLPNSSARAGYDTRSIFKRSLTGLNSEFSFSLTSCFTKAEEHSLPYYLSIAGRRIIGFIPFPRVLVLCEMQSVSSRILNRVAVSISYDDNHYTTGTSKSSDI